MDQKNLRMLNTNYYLFKYILQREIEGLTLKNQLTLLIMEAFIVFVPGFILHKKKKITFGRMISVFALIAYAGILFSFTVFRRQPGSRTGIVHLNINPGFGPGGIYSWWATILSIFNVFLFMPWGVVVCFLVKSKYGILRIIITTAIGFITSLIIEITQFYTGTGMFEATDLLTNTVGAFIGSLIASTALFIVRCIKKQYNY